LDTSNKGDSIYSTQDIFDKNGRVKDSVFLLADRRAQRLLDNQRTKQIAKATGFRILEDERKFIVPKELLLSTDELLQTTVLLLNGKIKFECESYESDIKFDLKNGADEPMYGLLYALKQPVKTRLVSSKTKTALFSAIGMSFRLRGWADQHNLSGALKPNNFFFGNKNDETVSVGNKEINVKYRAKTEIVSLFESEEAGAIFAQLYAFTLRLLKFADCPELEEYYMHKNLIGFDEMVKHGWISIFTDTGKGRKLTGYRYGTWPTRSNLYTKEEFRLISDAVAPYFESLEDLKKNYWEMLMANGYAGTDTIIRDRYSIRHEILAKFASTTTKRLQELRKLRKDDKLRKRQCLPAFVLDLLKQRENPTEVFIDEIKSIIKGKCYQKATLGLQIKHGIRDVMDVIPFLSLQIHNHYVNEGVYHEKKIKAPSFVVKTDYDYIKVIERSSRIVLHSINRAKLIKHFLECFVKQETPESRGYYRLRLAPIIENFISDGIELLKNTEDIVVKAVISSFYDGLNFSVTKLAQSVEIARPLNDEITKVAKTWSLKSGEDASVLEKVKKALAAWKVAGLFDTK